jgi:hypothetical protein
MIQNESGVLTSSPQEIKGKENLEEEKNEVAGDGAQIENSGLTKKRGRKPKEQQSPKAILEKSSVDVPEKVRIIDKLLDVSYLKTFYCYS